MGRNDEDLALIRRCLSEEPGGWRQFVARFAPTVKAIARRYLRLHDSHPDEGEIEDIVQEVFRAIVRRDYRLLRKYDPTYTVKTYLGVITRTEVYRSIRRRKSKLQMSGEIENLAPAGEDTTLAVERAEELDQLTRALGELPEREAEILRLRFLREMDYRRIAEALQIPEASVGQTLHRAKLKLLEKVRSLADDSTRVVPPGHSRG